MSAAPQWLDGIITEFGNSAGIHNLTLGEKGVASLAGENGRVFSFEYSYPNLVVMMTVPVSKNEEVAKKVLLLSEPSRQGKYLVRTGFMPHGLRAFFAVVAQQDSLSLPALSEIFRELRRLSDRFMGGSL